MPEVPSPQEESSNEEQPQNHDSVGLWLGAVTMGVAVMAATEEMNPLLSASLASGAIFATHFTSIKILNHFSSHDVDK